MFATLLYSVASSAVILTFITLCGLGVANLIGLRPVAGRILLAPGLFIVAITLTIGPLVELRLPVKLVSPYIWFGCLLLAFYGSRGLWEALESGRLRRALVLALILSLLVLAGFQWFGLFDYLGSPNQDGLTYVSFGEYLRLYSRGTAGGLPPLYQFGSHLANSRFIESAMLALFMPPWAEHSVDAQMMVGPLLLIGVFAFACSVAYVARIVDERGLRNSRELTTLLAVFGGWLPFVLLANNFSNLCMLGFTPALFGMALDPRLRGYPRYVAPSVFLAAAIYLYPALCVLVIAGFCVVGVENLLTTRRNSQIKLWVGVIALALALASIYLPNAFELFLQQLAITEPLVGGRPGNGFAPDLLVVLRLPAALWGFERTPLMGMTTETLSMWLGVLLALVTVSGLAAAIRARLHSLWLYFAMIVILVAFMIAIKKYDYGAYKILLLGWWATALLLSAGATFAWSALSATRLGSRLAVSGLVAGALTLSILLWGNQQFVWMQSFVYKDAKPLRELRDYVSGLHQVTTINISDPILSGWMVYELRHLPIHYDEYVGYLGQAHVLRVLARSNAPMEGGKYMVVGKDTMAIGTTVWSNNLFNVFQTAAGDPLVTLKKIDAPNRVERFDGSTFFWLGRGPTTIELNSRTDDQILMDIELVVGPDVGNLSKPLLIRVEVDGKMAEKFSAYSTPSHKVRLNLRQGTNHVVINALYDGLVLPNANGDSRVLLAGVKLKGLEAAK